MNKLVYVNGILLHEDMITNFGDYKSEPEDYLVFYTKVRAKSIIVVFYYSNGKLIKKVSNCIAADISANSRWKICGKTDYFVLEAFH